MTIDKTFYLIHATGAKLYPCLVKSKHTGSIAFRIAAPGKRDAEQQAEETTDIKAVMEKVYNQGYSVRARKEGGGVASSYRRHGRSIIGVWPESKT
jgi:hypothetical protein